ncbi:MAG: cobalamin-independent methionine synthase II family protein [SAR202 cluster bacterium]|nr:cobalamin-independent methionine synthase II family protein [SAR202 cluster bacterium]
MASRATAKARPDPFKTPFAAGVVGSLPRPPVVRETLPADPGAESVKQARSPRMDAFVRYAVALQEEAGLDVVSDGEWRRHSYTNIIGDIADGFSHDPREGRWGIAVTEKLAVRRPGLFAEEARFLVAATSRATKVCMPSPYLLGVRLWEKSMSTKAYPTRDAFIEEVVPILHKELVGLRDTGVSVVQIDDPHLCVLVDPKVRKTFADPKYELDLAVAKINEVIAGVKGLRLALHLCRRNWGRRGWGAEGGYEPVLDAMKRINVQQYVLEFSIPVAGDMAVLKGLPDDAYIGLGCLDCRFPKVEAPEEIAARVERAMQYVDAERLSLNPDCGFAPGRQSEVPLDEAYQKLKSEAAASAMLRDKHG